MVIQVLERKFVQTWNYYQNKNEFYFYNIKNFAFPLPMFQLLLKIIHAPGIRLFIERSTKLLEELFVVVILAIVSFTLCILLIQKNPTSYSSQCSFNENHTTLIFTQILFRHGERTPTDVGPYPNDPYIDYTYPPYGRGVLTDVGKRTLFQVGKYMKSYYCNLLENYHRDIVSAISSPMSRSRVALLIVLAAMFPPEKQQFPTDDLNWQPIAYDYELYDRDNIFVYFVNCKKYLNIYEIETKKSIANNEVENYQKLVGELEILTGTKYSSYRDLFYLYLHLKMQKDLGLQLPLWTKEYMPILKEYESISYNISTKTDELKTLSGGFILTEIIKSIQSKISDPKLVNRKIHLYSGHDMTIANLMGALNIQLKKTIAYGSYISFELHQINNNFAVKLLYHQTLDDHSELLTLDNCPEFCPLDTFLKIYSKYMATTDMCNL